MTKAMTRRMRILSTYRRLVPALVTAVVLGSVGTVGATTIVLVSHWQADGDAEDAAGTNGGALMNGAGFAPGMIGQSFSLDGQDDYVVVNTATSIPASGDISTVAAWVQFDEVDPLDTTSQPIIQWGSTSINSLRLLFLRFGRLGRGFFGNDHISNFTPIAGQWYHIAWVFGGNGNEDRLYVDGQLLHSVVVTNVNTIGTDVYIGRHFPNPIYFDGLIDEVKIWSEALSAAEISQEFEPVPVPSAGGWALAVLAVVLGILLLSRAYRRGTCGTVERISS